MQRRSLPVVPALVFGLVLAFASTALAHDPCTRANPHQNVYGNGYGTYGDGANDYARPYDGRSYGSDGPYGDGYGSYGHGANGYARPYDEYQPYDGGSRHGYSRPYSSSPRDGYGYDGYGYRSDGYGYREDHVRTSFKPFPFPHFEKRIVRHYHPY